MLRSLDLDLRSSLLAPAASPGAAEPETRARSASNAAPFRFRRVLAVSDLSAPAENAVWRAALVAREHGAWLRVLHVSSTRAAAERAQAALDTLAWHLQERLQLAVLAQAVSGSFREEVTAAARDAGLVVVRSSQHRAVRDWLAGTHPSRLVQVCPVPMLVVRRPATAGYHRVLVAADAGAGAAGSIAAAASMVRRPDLDLLSAVQSPEPPTVAFEHSPAMLLERQASMRAELLVVPHAARQGTGPFGGARAYAREILARASADVLVLPARGGRS